MLKSLCRAARAPCLAQSTISRAPALCIRARFFSPCTARLNAAVTLDPSASVAPNANPSGFKRIEDAYPLMKQAHVEDGKTEQPGRKVGYWLLGTAGLVYSIVVLGGLTRLTESGLSITEWKPVTGSVPPLNQAQWEAEFDLYRQSPEFKILNADLSLEDFKFIYNMEWSHRQLGRTIGLVFAVPALALIATKRYPIRFKLKLAGIASLIGFQGFIGWWMVRSGLDEDITTPRVSQYRLATHLGTAFVVYLSMLHTGLTLLAPSNPALGQATPKALTGLPIFQRAVLAFGALTYLTALSGAFVAGLDAGLIYNDFPYMGNSYIPPINELKDRTLPSLGAPRVGFASTEPAPSEFKVWIHNMFENPVLAQLDHRILAMTTFTAGWGLLALAILGARRGRLPKTATTGAAWMAGLVSMQATLGITTLWYLVPTPLAAAHQAGSLAVLTGVVVLAAKLRVPAATRSAMTFTKVARQQANARAGVMQASS
ncbi:cytochrome oxidase assembly protein-domain-containing protein [Protomyces lactucae-debilis]|uniref:Cytochrome oxidase assembly protein-domain-containing protein n=1 Tax=Protomyces lactucae-debilis TaxID=2754530 RepID=A0A1Y2FLV3_PROLT|nr:cytochrome oxidase assembly protein-domain-containing protein [Protomyces lactucae-debilis]ORY84938.1 cytochrome oxidase assembly protein-domain-containing protein [Protomyces lactucae-debilis]